MLELESAYLIFDDMNTSRKIMGNNNKMHLCNEELTIKQ